MAYGFFYNDLLRQADRVAAQNGVGAVHCQNFLYQHSVAHEDGVAPLQYPTDMVGADTVVLGSQSAVEQMAALMTFVLLAIGQGSGVCACTPARCDDREE